MSKFWASRAEESSNESETELAEFTVEKRKPTPAPAHFTAFSSSEDDERRVVRNPKQRVRDALKAAIARMKNSMKIGDHAQILKHYDVLVKTVEKSNKIIEEDGYPNFFVSALNNLENYVNEQLRNKSTFNKLSKNRALALNTLKAKFRKMNPVWLDLIAECALDPGAFQDTQTDSEEDEISEEESSDEEDVHSNVENELGSDLEYEEINKNENKLDVLDEIGDEDGDDDISEFSDFGDDTDSDIDSIDHDIVAPSKGRWLKVTAYDKGPEKPKPVRKTHTEPKKPSERIDVVSAPMRPEASDLLDMSDLTPENIKTKLTTIVEKRGRKGNDRYEQIFMLKKLAENTKEVDVQSYIDVMAQLITSEFDTSAGPTAYQSTELWLETFDNLTQVMNILEVNTEAYISDIVPSNTSTIEEKDTTKTTISIFSAFLERLDDELYKALQLKDLHSDEYKVRLGHTIDLLMILSRFYEYAKKIGKIDLITSICSRIFEQIYNKHNQLAIKTWELVKKRSPKPLEFLNAHTIDPEQLINIFYNIIAQYGNQREKVHSQLYLCYNKCLHDKYYEARDLLQIPNMYEMCMQLDIHTQILYNRDLVQLGLAAFRRGYINEAYQYLAEICIQNRHKELLAQAVSMLKNQEKTIEQEKAERRRLLPYHLHINLDLVEGVHNICAMLLEIPARAKNKYSTDFQISRQFSRMLEIYTSQPFQGPPENSKEFVLAATKCLQKGDWKMCSLHIFELNIWDKFHTPEDVKNILLERIKLEAMRTYVFSYLNLYNSFSVTQLASMFEIKKNQVHSVVSKMMVNGEILASWDEKSENIIINRVEPTRLQQLALSLSENIAMSVEQNDLTLNMKNPKMVLSYDRRTPFQIFGDRQHWGIGQTDVRRNRIAKKTANTHTRYKTNNRSSNTKRYNQDSSLPYKPLNIRQVMA